MPYEGYDECLDENGFYFVNYNLHRCYIPAEAVWIHLVDVTNGYNSEDKSYATCNAPKIPNGFVDIWKEDHYGNKYAEKILKWLPDERYWQKVK